MPRAGIFGRHEVDATQFRIDQFDKGDPQRVEKAVTWQPRPKGPSQKLQAVGETKQMPQVIYIHCVCMVYNFFQTV